ncbi:hypothetical protein D9M70_544570 [compost metagenome]
MCSPLVTSSFSVFLTGVLSAIGSDGLRSVTLIGCGSRSASRMTGASLRRATGAGSCARGSAATGGRLRIASSAFDWSWSTVAESVCGGAFHSNASSRPLTGETGSQVGDVTPSAVQAGSRGLRRACAIQWRMRPSSPVSASSMSASNRKTLSVGSSLAAASALVRARSSSRASSAASATAAIATALLGLRASSLRARFNRSTAVSPPRART